jgi:hypothetical protein
VPTLCRASDEGLRRPQNRGVSGPFGGFSDFFQWFLRFFPVRLVVSSHFFSRFSIVQRICGFSGFSGSVLSFPASVNDSTKWHRHRHCSIYMGKWVAMGWAGDGGRCGALTS